MKTDILQKELNNLIHLTKRWEEQSYIPKIEKDIALKRVQNIYAALLGIEVEEESDIAPQISNFNAAAPIQVAAPDDQQESEAETAQTVQKEESIAECECETEKEAIEEVEIPQPEADEIPEAEEKEEITEPVIEKQPQEEVQEQVQEEVQEQPQEEVQEQVQEEVQEQPQEEVQEPEPEPEPEVIVDNSITIIEQMMNEAQKMQFTHDLFCNDYTIFKNEIRKINKLDSLDEVLIYIEEYYRWSSENQSALEFVELVATKFQNN